MRGAGPSGPAPFAYRRGNLSFTRGRDALPMRRLSLVPALLCLAAPLCLAALSGCAASGPLSYAGSPGCDVVTAVRMTLAGLPRPPPPPPPAPYCTRSLGDADCWSDPAKLRDHPPQLADGGWVAPTPILLVHPVAIKPGEP